MRWRRVGLAALVVGAGLAGLAGGMALRGPGGGEAGRMPPPLPAGGALAPPLERPSQPLVGVWPGVQVDEAARQGVSDALLALLNAYVQALRAADPAPLAEAALPPARESLAQVVRELGGQGFVVEELSVTPVIVDVRQGAVTVQMELYLKGAPAPPGQAPDPGAERREGLFRWYVGFARQGDRYVASTLTGAPEMPWRQPGAVPPPGPTPGGGGS